MLAGGVVQLGGNRPALVLAGVDLTLDRLAQALAGPGDLGEVLMQDDQVWGAGVPLD